jgi:hypothetical protein
MNATTKTVTVQEIIEPKDLLDYTSPRLSRRQYRAQISASRKSLHEALRHNRSYCGGLPAEIQSAKSLSVAAVKQRRKEARRAWANRTGRPIDLKTLMGQLHQDGTPVWAIVDPAMPIGETNGKYDIDGMLSIGGGWWKLWPRENCPLKTKAFLPNGIPALPAKARRLLTDPIIRRRAAWIGVLYQPAAWTEVKPDPAVVVSWSETPEGEYSALAVWGGDYHRIMEFVR